MVNGRKNGWSFPLTKATRPTAFCWAVASTTWARTVATTIDGEVEHEGGIITGVMIGRRDR